MARDLVRAMSHHEDTDDTQARRREVQKANQRQRNQEDAAARQRERARNRIGQLAA